MKNKAILFLLFLSLILVMLVSCSDETTKPKPDPSVKIIFPDGGDSLGIGIVYKILWEDDFEEDVNIEINQGHDSNAVRVLYYPDIPSNGEFEFLVPLDMDAAADYKVKITSVMDSTISDKSDDYFGFTESVGDIDDEPINASEIYVPHIGDYAIYPSGDTDWFKVFLNSNQKYIFENSSADDFDTEFYLYKGNSEGTDIVELLLNDDDSGSGLQPYLEFTPEEDGYFFLRVALFSNDPLKSDKSDIGYYTLRVTENISLLTPNGGEVWMRDSLQIITWDPDIAGNVVLSLTKADVSVLEIATVSGSDGSYSWIIPDSVSSGFNYRIRIQDEDDSQSLDESDDYFAVAGTENEIVTGQWNVEGTWDKWEGVWTFNGDGTWSNSWGTSGTWELTANIIKWSYDTGTYYLGLIDGDTMSGIMNGGSGLYGTWTASRSQL